MKIYISGKIKGLPFDVAYFNFKTIENKLVNDGHKVVNPMSRKYIKNRVGKLPWIVHMFFDILLLMRCDAIYMQKNWLDSRGARIEFKFAKRLKLKIIYSPVCDLSFAKNIYNETYFLDKKFKYRILKFIEENQLEAIKQHEREKLLNMNKDYDRKKEDKRQSK